MKYQIHQLSNDPFMTPLETHWVRVLSRLTLSLTSLTPDALPQPALYFSFQSGGHLQGD